MRIHTFRRVGGLLAAAVLSWSFPAMGQVASTPDQKIAFDHVDDANGREVTIYLDPGQTFQVVLTNTCADKFKITLGKERPQSADPNLAPRSLSAGCSPQGLPSAVVQVDGPAVYGVTVEYSQPGAQTVTVDLAGSLKTLTPVNYRVKVLPSQTTEDPWSAAFSGGFTVSTLTNPKYSLKPITATPGSYTVDRNKGNEDEVSLGFAGFATLFHRDCNWGPSFGLGINNGEKLNYFMGGAYRFGKRNLGILSFGANVGQVDALPNGLHKGDTTTDANALSNLGSKTDYGFYVGLSYSFLGGEVQSAFQSKLKFVNQPAGTTPQAETTPAL